MAEPIIQVFHVSKKYLRGDRPALHDVNLSVEKGEFVFLTGPSGAGKTTLLKLIFAAERATSGQILVNGQNLVRMRPGDVPMLRRRIGVVFQDFKLIGSQTVRENIEYPLHVIGLDEKEIGKRVYRVLKGVDLYDKAHVLPETLSGGEQQRIAIARAIVNDPLILLADEPTGNLDEETTRDVMALFEAANARGTTILFATHDRGLIDHYRKRLIYLKKGVVEPAPARVTR